MISLAKNILFGVFFGIILVMFFYNLFIYFVVKDTIYLYYVVYIFVVGLVQATIEGYCFQYAMLNNSFLATRSFFLLTAFCKYQRFRICPQISSYKGFHSPA
ncbi:MAG TPA: hypothetical protein DCO83_02490 [Mucilaginibacter sp.]|nr:hypothetical protein [Mucilaginibacter sp.]